MFEELKKQIISLKNQKKIQRDSDRETAKAIKGIGKIARVFYYAGAQNDIKKNLCFTKNTYWFWRGNRAKNTIEKFKKHLEYLQREDHFENLGNKRDCHFEIKNEFGNNQTIEKILAELKEKNVFISHKLMISPPDSANLDAEKAHVVFEKTLSYFRQYDTNLHGIYTFHTDTKHPHLHCILSSKNKFEIRAEQMKEVKKITLEVCQEKSKKKLFGIEL